MRRRSGKHDTDKPTSHRSVPDAGSKTKRKRFGKLLLRLLEVDPESLLSGVEGDDEDRWMSIEWDKTAGIPEGDGKGKNAVDVSPVEPQEIDQGRHNRPSSEWGRDWVVANEALGMGDESPADVPPGVLDMPFQARPMVSIAPKDTADRFIPPDTRIERDEEGTASSTAVEIIAPPLRLTTPVAAAGDIVQSVPSSFPDLTLKASGTTRPASITDSAEIVHDRQFKQPLESNETSDEKKSKDGVAPKDLARVYTASHKMYTDRITRPPPKHTACSSQPSQKELYELELREKFKVRLRRDGRSLADEIEAKRRERIKEGEAGAW